MGGKLFNLPRMPCADYREREAFIRGYLDRKLDGHYRIPRYYGDKPDFGDMDVIVPTRADWGVFREEIATDLGVTRKKSIGRVFSVVFRELQTDFFAVPEPFVESTYTYMCFNDLGNLLGRILRRFNLKYGEEGLVYVYRRAGDGGYKADLPITRDFNRICTFLEVDHAQWIAGFDTLTEVYEWVILSPYFSVAPYLDDLGGTMERRLSKRPGIDRFVEFLRKRGIDKRPPFADKTHYLPQIISAFPEAELARAIEEERAKEARMVAISEKFNGHRVMMLRPELSGKALGAFIVAFKQSFDDFHTFVLETDGKEIDRRILAFETEPNG